MQPVISKFFAKTLLATFFASQLYYVVSAQQSRPRDGQFIGKSNTGDNVYAVVRSGKVISARFEQRVAGCDNSDPNWDCSRVNRQIRVIDSCTIAWTVPWEDGYSFSAKLENMSC